MTRSVVRTRNLLLILVLAAVLAAAVGWQSLATRTAGSTASAAVNVRITMAVVGQLQGAFKGDDFSVGKSSVGLINVLAFSAEVNSPRDPATGLPTGKRQWKPVVATHLLGGSSPEFMFAASTNENLKSVVINFYHSDRAGKEINYYRVTLTNASVGNVRQYSSGGDVLEDDTLYFQKIEEQDFIAKTTAIDEISSALT
jgi:type VI secretion system secreted protein Hcp